MPSTTFASLPLSASSLAAACLIVGHCHAMFSARVFERRWPRRLGKLCRALQDLGDLSEETTGDRLTTTGFPFLSDCLGCTGRLDAQTIHRFTISRRAFSRPTRVLTTALRRHVLIFPRACSSKCCTRSRVVSLF